MDKMKKILTFIIVVCFAVNSAGQGYALRPMAARVLREAVIDIATSMGKEYEDTVSSLMGALSAEPITDFSRYIHTIVNQVIATMNHRASRNKLFVIAIDGNSGAAKTTTANELARYLLKKHGKKAIVIERDWFINSRDNRYGCQDKELSRQVTSVRDNDISLRTEKFTSDVLEKLRAFNSSTDPKMELVLTELYDKYGGGGLTRTESFEIDQDTIVIIEGNFLLIDAWEKYFDFKVLMLAEPFVGLERRLPRDNHSDPERVKNVFWRMNTPSFIDYLQNLKVNPDIIVRTDSWDIGNQLHAATAEKIRKKTKSSSAGEEKPYALIDTKTFKDDAYRALKYKLVLLKMGDQSTINDYANQMSYFIKSRLGRVDSKEWILFHWRVKSMPLPHAFSLVLNAISEKLGIEMRCAAVDPDLFARYLRLSPIERKQMVAETAANLRLPGMNGKKVIVLDDVFCTGAVLDGMRTVAASSNAREMQSFVIFDATDNPFFESDIYSMFMHEKRDQVIALLNSKSRLTDSLFQYLIRFAAESPGEFKILIDQIHPGRVEELIRTVNIYKQVPFQGNGIDYNPFLQIAANTITILKVASLNTKITLNKTIQTAMASAA